jgi:hypothetical protein
MNGNGKNLEDLFNKAEAEGRLSPEGKQVLNIVDLGAQIQAGLGVTVDDVESSDVVLVTMMPDDSSSIASAGNTKSVIEGHNLVLGALEDTKQRDSILAHTRYLNGRVLFPYTNVKLATRMDKNNYHPTLATPLYDQAVLLLGTVIAKAEEFAAAGVPSRTVTLIITDGADCGSTWAKPKDVRALVRDLEQSEGHIVAAMGIDDGATPFRQVFRDMGISDKWILTPKADAASVRRAFAMFSQSAVRASQGAATFSKTAAGGFGTP